MTATADAAAQETGRSGVGKIALASLVGTTIEFYDFYIFGTAAALVFGPMFFPKSAPETQTLNAYLTFGIAFLARPLGSFLFGHFGDRIGRKSTLVATMLTMGVATTLIGLLPCYAHGRCVRATGPRRAAVPAGRRPRRRMGRRGAGRGRERARGTPRLVRHVSAARAADRLFHRDRPLSPAPPRLRRGGVRRLGLAHPVPPQRRAGRRSASICASRSRRRRPSARRSSADDRVAVPLAAILTRSLVAADPGLARHRRLLRPLLYRDGLCAGLRGARARHSAHGPSSRCCARRSSSWPRRTPSRRRSPTASAGARFCSPRPSSRSLVGLAMPCAARRSGLAGVFAFLVARARSDGAHLRAAWRAFAGTVSGSRRAIPAPRAPTISAASLGPRSRPRWRKSLEAAGGVALGRLLYRDCGRDQFPRRAQHAGNKRRTDAISGRFRGGHGWALCQNRLDIASRPPLVISIQPVADPTSWRLARLSSVRSCPARR